MNARDVIADCLKQLRRPGARTTDADVERMARKIAREEGRRRVAAREAVKKACTRPSDEGKPCLWPHCGCYGDGADALIRIVLAAVPDRFDEGFEACRVAAVAVVNECRNDGETDLRSVRDGIAALKPGDAP